MVMDDSKYVIELLNTLLANKVPDFIMKYKGGFTSDNDIDYNALSYEIEYAFETYKIYVHVNSTGKGMTVSIIVRKYEKNQTLGHFNGSVTDELDVYGILAALKVIYEQHYSSLKKELIDVASKVTEDDVYTKIISD
jgi:hypothetical protein